MKRLAVSVIAGVMLLGSVGTVWANEYTVDNPPSKGVILEGDKHCVGETHQQGHHFTVKTWIAFDGGEMARDPQAEKLWQEGQCKFEVDLLAGYWYARSEQGGLTYDPSQTTYHTTTAK